MAGSCRLVPAQWGRSNITAATYLAPRTHIRKLTQKTSPVAAQVGLLSESDGDDCRDGTRVARAFFLDLENVSAPMSRSAPGDPREISL
ncbi:hypothetical protein E2C01_076166 [Portunus trituberculatus]|uniref:Uncharacterized protein n=1 Tax=Portunus trituberculatus TaxID=210409 RepID=A0A5B7IMX6_PORTR|nr:hypothetical protein [Portunus trituberculatus]